MYVFDIRADLTEKRVVYGYRCAVNENYQAGVCFSNCIWCSL
jgi:hypothetical protein